MSDHLPLSDAFAATGVTIRRVGDGPLRRFQVLGERSSGTNLLRRLMMRHSPLDASEELGWKHGFPHMLAVPPDLVVLCIVRNAADWARSMHAKPWHTPPAMQQLEFSAFLRAPWETVIDRARYFGGASARPLVGQPLQHDRDPVTGAAYPNIFAMRTAKLRALTGMFRRGCTVALVRMEAMQSDPETVVTNICSELSLALPNTPFDPIKRRLGSKFKAAVDVRPETPAHLSEVDLAYLRSQVDTPLEAALGYSY